MLGLPKAEISVRPSLFCFSFIPYSYYFPFPFFTNPTTTQLWDTGGHIPDISPRGYGGLAESRVV